MHVKRNRKRFRTPVQITIFDESKMVLDKVFEEFPVVIGRSPRCDIAFPQHDFISKQHAAIVEVSQDVVIVDLESSNGIFFQGKKTKKAPVTEDGMITIGTLTLRFRYIANELSHAVTVVPSKTAAVQEDPDITAITNTNPQRKNQPLPEAPFQKNTHKSTVAPRELELPKQPTPSISKPDMRKHSENTHESILDGEFKLVAPHPMAGNLKPNQRVLEGFITWKDTVYDVQQFQPGEKVTVGRGPGVGLSLPTLTKKTDLAYFDGGKTQCLIPTGSKLSVRTQHRELTLEELMKSQAVTKHASGYLLKLGAEELVSFDVGPDIHVHFRYAPMARQLTRVKVVEPDEEIRKSTLVSGFIHVFIMVLAALNAPPNHGPKLENVPERYARLLVEPPRKLIEEPKPTPTPEPPKPEKIVKKEKPVKQKIVKKVVQEKPKKVVLTKSPVLKQVNKFPVQVRNPMPTPPKPQVNVNNLGALSALTALAPSNSKSTSPVSININKNAGGPSKFTTSGVLGTLKSSSGKLSAGGIQSVQTKGLGVGSGIGYGVQGLKGNAGTRGVAGSVVGTPRLLSVGADEGLTRAQVMDVVKRYLGEIQQCYERSLFQTPGLAGKVEYEWEITPKGKVSSAKVKSTQMSGADAMNSCVVGVFKKMQFPVAKNGQSTVPSIPLEFGKL